MIKNLKWLNTKQGDQNRGIHKPHKKIVYTVCTSLSPHCFSNLSTTSCFLITESSRYSFDISRVSWENICWDHFLWTSAEQILSQYQDKNRIGATTRHWQWGTLKMSLPVLTAPVIGGQGIVSLLRICFRVCGVQSQPFTVGVGLRQRYMLSLLEAAGSADSLLPTI